MFGPVLNGGSCPPSTVIHHYVATDRARLDRILAVSGSDAAVLAEITAAGEFIYDQHHPDLAALLALAITRNLLGMRNRYIPNNLPAVWVLGDPARAEALAESIFDRGMDERAPALATVAEALAKNGDADRSCQNFQRAEAIARSIIDAPGQARALAAVAEALAGTGDGDRSRHVFQRAEDIARSITRSPTQEKALTAVAEALASACDAGRAEAIADSMTNRAHREQALAGVARALAGAGDVDRAEAIADSITDPYDRARVLAAVAEALAGTGDADRARQVGQRAEAIAYSITDQSDQALALASVAEALAVAGDAARSRQLVEQAEAIARSITDQSGQERALAVVAEVLAKVGDVKRAKTIVDSITNPYDQAQALAAMTALAREERNSDRTKHAINTCAAKDDFALTQITSASDEESLHQLLALLLTRWGPYYNLLSLLARVQPAVIIKAVRHVV